MYRCGGEVHLGQLVDEAEGHEGNGEPGEEDAHNNERAAYPRADSEVVFKDVGQLRVQPVRVGRKPVQNPPAARSIQHPRYRQYLYFCTSKASTLGIYLGVTSKKAIVPPRTRATRFLTMTREATTPRVWK